MRKLWSPDSCQDSRSADPATLTLLATPQCSCSLPFLFLDLLQIHSCDKNIMNKGRINWHIHCSISIKFHGLSEKKPKMPDKLHEQSLLSVMIQPCQQTNAFYPPYCSMPCQIDTPSPAILPIPKVVLATTRPALAHPSLRFDFLTWSGWSCGVSETTS